MPVADLDVVAVGAGFDAISGALRQIDVRGTSGVALADRWAAGPRAYLGIATPGSRTCSS
jgi:cyclohexanone monooxygenase